jgi:hypothetical protein
MDFPYKKKQQQKRQLHRPDGTGRTPQLPLRDLLSLWAQLCLLQGLATAMDSRQR